MELRQALIAFLLPAAAFAQVERFAVVVGNDVGQPPDVALSYAETDAQRMAGVLQEVGGVRPENLVVLRGQDAATVRRTLIAVNERVRTAGHQTVLVVYYSGHADANALHLGGTELELGELEQLVRGSAASFRLLILDACRSGALTRVKGGAPIPPFDIRLGERVAGEGAVFLTSSSASEDSQESDEIKGSFFTHALVSGLLGAADDNGDGRVTLDEAYRYSYETTLRESSRTLAGIQHPTFEYAVRGQGDLVLATLPSQSASRAWVELPPGRTWLLFQNSEDGPVVGEVSARDAARRLSLKAGRYFARGRGPDVLLEGPFDAPAGASVRLDEARLERTAYARLVRKGGGGGSDRSGRDRRPRADLARRRRGRLRRDRGRRRGGAAGGDNHAAPRLVPEHVRQPRHRVHARSVRSRSFGDARLGPARGLGRARTDRGRGAPRAALPHQRRRAAAVDGGAAALADRGRQPRLRAQLPVPARVGVDVSLPRRGLADAADLAQALVRAADGARLRPAPLIT